MNKQEVSINIEDIYYNPEEEDKLEKNLLYNKKYNDNNNSNWCYHLFVYFFYCFM